MSTSSDYDEHFSRGVSVNFPPLPSQRLAMSGVVRTLSRCLLPAEASRDTGGSKEGTRERNAAQEREAKRRSREIDAMLARERRAVRRLVKILLLGAGESGKSTFLKQMRIINGQEFDQKALLDFRDTIYENILKVWRRFRLGEGLNPHVEGQL